jgi:class 3 adenylate cyclase/tetratricopeptide (TPR) repeat protein
VTAEGCRGGADDGAARTDAAFRANRPVQPRKASLAAVAAEPDAVTTCPSCARENPADFAFCPACGARLVPAVVETPAAQSATAGEAAPKALTEERKVVSTLFCDLVSYTAHSEGSDHELIDALLQRYNALARRLVEGHGGVVEKFIGDAVLAVFGFPKAHDDDAERAVRCALKLAAEAGSLTWPDGDPVEVRIGVNSGETYLHTDVDPASGETFLTGDAVNTAARLETAAPPGGVVVGALTHALTERTIAYDELPPLIIKGKAEPVPAWRAREPIARTGLRTTGAADTPFVGRQKELSELLAAFDAVVSTNEARFLLLAGEPGIGKSRLVLEFARALEARPELVTWRQGRCLAYGDGSGFAALADIVKAHAGILDSDDVATVEARLEIVLPEGDDRPWLRQRLRPLLGLESAPATQEENFAAWSRFLAHLASSGPTVLVLEDLHWAGEGMLAFVQHLTAPEREVPLLVLATARPELLGQCHDLLSPSESVSRLTLSPLTRRVASRLVSALLDQRLAAEMREPILERVGGNPLYAEEYVRLLLDRGLLLKTKGVLRLTEGEELPLPDTVQAVLAARFDTLPPEHKALLCDASVFGEHFWAGGVAALAGGSATEVDAAMTALAERQLVRPLTSRTLEGESEYLFWHALARDVAYEELPRRARARKHRQAALWVEAQAGERIEEFAQTLAHHSVTSLELALAVGETDSAEELLVPATRHLTLAGDHTMRLDVIAAERYYARAAELLCDDPSNRARLLTKQADALHACLRYREAVPLLEEAVALLRRTDDRRSLALALIALSRARSYLNELHAEVPVAEALAILGDDPSPELVKVLAFASLFLTVSHDDSADSEQMADRALLVARRLSLPVDVSALGARGVARVHMGDRRGIDDLRLAIEEAQVQGLVLESCLLHINLAVNVYNWEGPSAEILWLRRAVRLAQQCGSRFYASAARTLVCDAQLSSGDWDEAMAETAVLLPALQEAGDTYDLVTPHALRVLVSVDRGDDGGLDDSAAWLAAWARDGALEDRPLCVAVLAALALRRQRPAEALGLLESGLPGDAVSANFRANLGAVLTRFARMAMSLGRPDLAASLAAPVGLVTPFHDYVRGTVAALAAEAEGRTAEAAAGFAAAAAGWRDFGVPYEEAQALLGQGRCLVSLGRAAAAAAPLAAAREIFARLGAKPALAETDRWLEGVGT